MISRKVWVMIPSKDVIDYYSVQTQGQGVKYKCPTTGVRLFTKQMALGIMSKLNEGKLHG